jgi:type II secretory pathway component PulM
VNELIGRLQVLWEGLAPRERLLVGLAGGALAVTILLVGIVMPIQAAN